MLLSFNVFFFYLSSFTLVYSSTQVCRFLCATVYECKGKALPLFFDRYLIEILGLCIFHAMIVL